MKIVMTEGTCKERFISCIKFEFLTSSAKDIKKRKPAGWRSMPYILGNECFERLATFALLANFIVYLRTQFNMDQVSGTICINVWAGTSNVSPLIGAYISDSMLGKFITLVYSSFVSLLGLTALTLTAIVPELKPPTCTTEQMHQNQCIKATTPQLAFLWMTLILLSIGAGGIRPCSLPFGVDQFDISTESGRHGMNSYFNWYYFTFTIVSILASTLVVYVQTNVSWAWGLAIPTFLMFLSIVMFFLGARLYIYVPPGKSVFSSILQVFVVAYKKRKLELPRDDDVGALYNPLPPLQATIVTKVPLTQQYRKLNKAAIIREGDLNPDGSCANEWNLCSIQQIEEVKCLVRVLPIWFATVICFLAMAQQDTYTVAQALYMDRHIGRKFQIPAGSVSVISMITLATWIPLYDRIIVPRLEKVTNKEGGFTLLQRMGIGLVFAILSMVFAGLVEIKRRSAALAYASPDGVAPVRVWWLVPQLACVGLANAFIMIGQIEFFYKEFPEDMKSLGNSIFFGTLAGSSYLSGFLVSVIHKYTGRHGQPNWLDVNINKARVEYFYFLIGGLGVLNFVYFQVIAHKYQYKNSVIVVVEDDAIELSSAQ